ncbi:MAG: glucose-6-phosphate isomerase [Pseudomonadota bacterium]
MPAPTSDAFLSAIRDCYTSGLNALFAASPTRASDFSFDVAGLYFDFSKLHISEESMAAGAAFAETMDFAAWREQLLSGGIVNQTENRPAIHSAMRAAHPTLADRALTNEILAARTALDGFAQQFETGEFTSSNGAPYTHILHLGIGGSALGPDMLLKAAAGMGLKPMLEAHVVANIDAAALLPALDACVPETTLVVLASKSFTTVETMTNAKTVQAWMQQAGIANPRAQMIAVTAAPDKALAYGIPEAQILAFPESVGGRYSIWSAVSLPFVLAFGLAAFHALLAGAAAMDTHFAESRVDGNVCAIAALMDYAYANALGADSRATFAYDDRLGLLPSYLQQLETESNGKHVSREGEPLDVVSSPAVWGGVGTDAQHAVFQLLHQGRVLVPTEFIAAAQPAHPHHDHHALLLSNCLAQSAALMAGRTPQEAAKKLGCAPDDPLAVAKSFPGNRPSTTILLPELTPFTLGALLAFYEHRVFALSVLLGINPFDQMGVELGKEMAKQLEGYLGPDAVAPDAGLDASTRALLRFIQP